MKVSARKDGPTTTDEDVTFTSQKKAGEITEPVIIEIQAVHPDTGLPLTVPQNVSGDVSIPDPLDQLDIPEADIIFKGFNGSLVG